MPQQSSEKFFLRRLQPGFRLLRSARVNNSLKSRLGALLLVGSALLSGAVSVQAADVSTVPAGVAKTILDKLQAARVDLDYGEVRSSPVEGWYQVQVTGGPLLYVSADGDFALTGTLLGVTSNGFVDMRQLLLQPLRKEKLEKVAASDEIIFPAEGKRKAYVYVFTDIDCGYCRKLHKEVPAMNALGIEVRYLGYPRAGVGSPSYDKLVSAWCSDDPRKTLTDLKKGGSYQKASCDNPVAEQYQLGGELGVQGTPAVILADGTMLPGYVEAEELARILKL